jgi:hypothetical protein
VFLVLDVEVVEDLLLFGLGNVGVVVLGIKLAFPEVDFRVLLLDQFDEVLILLDEVGVLGEQQLDLFLQVVDLLILANLEDQFFVEGNEFALQLT